MVSKPISHIKGNLEDYDRWVTTNKPKQFSLFDYVHAVSREQSVKGDYIVSLFALLWPEYYKIDQHVFLAEQFSLERYNQIKNSNDTRAAEEFMNAIPISEMFANADFKTQKIIGDMIAEAWTAKLKLEFPKMKFTAVCYEDEPKDLWCSFYQTQII